MKLLDLFCGAGGATRGYQLAGWHVTGVDLVASPRYVGDDFHQGDALEYLAEHGRRFDAIHASPPCQGYSSKTRDPARHPRLIAPVRELLAGTGRPWVIENVVGAAAEMRSPVRLCGSSFGLGVRRHRLFESSVALLVPPCDHGSQPRRYRLYDHGRWYMSSVVHVFGTGGGKGKEHWPEAMGVDWMTNAELVEAIPPAYTEHIGHQLAATLEAAA